MKRPYLVRLYKNFVYGDKVYNNSSHFCIKDLRTPKLKKYFTSDHIQVRVMIVNDLTTRLKKVVYQGKDYDEYLKAVEEYLQ